MIEANRTVQSVEVSLITPSENTVQSHGIKVIPSVICPCRELGESHVVCRTEVGIHVLVVEFKGHCQHAFDFSPTLFAIFDTAIGHVDGFCHSIPCDGFLVLALQLLHEIRIPINRQTADYSQRYIWIYGLNQVAIRVFVEGVYDDQISSKADLNASDFFGPTNAIHNVGGDHLNLFVIGENVSISIGVEPICEFHFMQRRFAARRRPIGSQRDVDARLMCCCDVGRLAIQQ